jgi:uncharacterized protein (DUF1501 family)
MKHFHILTRRGFLGRSAKLGLSLALSTLFDIPLVMRRALAASGVGTNGKKVLFIWLRGANDGLNSVVPIMDNAYVDLSSGNFGKSGIRPTLVVPPQAGLDYSASGVAAFDPTQDLLDDNNPANVVPRGPSDATFGYAQAIRLGNGFAALHPSLKFLAPVYNAGDLALVHRVAYPRQSRSHFDSQRYWENGAPNNNLVNDGIFYRAIWQYGLGQTAPLSGVEGVSIQSALPLILRGAQAALTNLSDPTRYNLLSIPTPTGDAKADAALFAANVYPFPDKMDRELLALQYGNLQNTLGLFAAMDFSETGNTFQDDALTDNDSDWANAHGGKGYYLFPTTNEKNGGWRRPDNSTRADKYVIDPSQESFFRNLKAAALVLNHTPAIIAGTEIGGFDTHNNQGKLTGAQPNLLRTIGWALYALRKYFQNYADQATWQNLVVVTLSEFGRTTVENSTVGTDHAEANVMFLAGGAVKGQSKGNSTGVFNCGGATDLIPWATGTAGSMFAVQGGYLKRTTDYRSVLGEVIRKHLGATDSQIQTILPGYQAEPELGGQRVVAASSVDGTPITGEIGFL